MVTGFKPKSEFSRNVLTLMTGTTIAQALPIAVSPILTRIYTPENFGVFALFYSIVLIFGVVTTGKYELALVIPEKDEDAINILALGLIINGILSVVLLFFAILFNQEITNWLGNQEISFWLYFAPLLIFLVGFFNLLNYFNIRKKHFGDIATANIIKSIALSVAQLTIGALKSGATGLVTGQIFSQLFANFRLAKNIYNDSDLINSITVKKMAVQGKRFIKFPKFSMLSELINSISHNGLQILIPIFFNIKTLGYYSLVYKILALPMSLIGAAISQVYIQEAASELRETSSIKKSFDHVLIKLLSLAPIFAAAYFFIGDFFVFAFGSNWAVAGEYAEILLPLFFIRLVSSTLSTTLSVLELQKQSLYINIILLVSTATIVFVAVVMSYDFSFFLRVFSFALAFEYLFFLIYYFSLSREDYETIP